MKLGRFLLPVNRKPPEPDGSPLRNSVLRPGRHGDRRAVASPLQKAVLQRPILEQLGAQPDAAGDQHHGDHQCQEIHRHAVAVIVAGFGALIFGQVVDRRVTLRIGWRPPPAAAWRCPAWPEAQHTATLVIWGHAIGCHDGPDGFLLEPQHSNERSSCNLHRYPAAMRQDTPRRSRGRLRMVSRNHSAVARCAFEAVRSGNGRSRRGAAMWRP
jgi:hypothetical protein